MIVPNKDIAEALSNLKRSREGQLLVGWIEASLADRRATVETAGSKDRDFHAGAASELAEIVASIQSAR